MLRVLVVGGHTRRHVGGGRRKASRSGRRRRDGLLRRRAVEESGRHGLRLGGNVSLLGLGGELALRLVAVPVALAVLLEGVLHGDLVAEDVLAVEVVNGGVAALKVAEADEAEALAAAGVVAGDLGQGEQGAEAAKGVVEDLLVGGGVEVADKELGANVGRLLLVGRGLVDAQRLAKQLDAVHDVGGVLGVGGRAELDEAEALVRLRDAVARHVDVLDRAHLQHHFVYHVRGRALVNVADVDGGVLVLFPVRWGQVG